MVNLILNPEGLKKPEDAPLGTKEVLVWGNHSEVGGERGKNKGGQGEERERTKRTKGPACGNHREGGGEDVEGIRTKELAWDTL